MICKADRAQRFGNQTSNQASLPRIPLQVAPCPSHLLDSHLLKSGSPNSSEAKHFSLPPRGCRRLWLLLFPHPLFMSLGTQVLTQRPGFFFLRGKGVWGGVGRDFQLLAFPGGRDAPLAHI